MVRGNLGRGVMFAVVIAAGAGGQAACAQGADGFQAEYLRMIADGPVADAAASEPDALARLAAMTESMRQGNYVGTYVHVRGDQIDTTRIEHLVTESGSQERLITLNGEPREIVRHGAHCECQWPARKEVVFGDFPSVRSRLSGERFAHPDLLAANYRIVGLGVSRVAGRACHLIGLVPRDALRYGYKLCVGDSAHLLLRMSIYNEDGLPIEHDFFTQIAESEHPADNGQLASDPIPLGTPKTVPPGFKVVEDRHSAPPEPLAVNEGWIVSPDLPGYHIKSRVWRENPVTHHRFEHMIVTDGLSAASVFVEDLPENQGLDPDAAKYGMNIYVRQAGPMRITVIGDLPMAAIKQICLHTVPAKTSAGQESEQNPLHVPGNEARK
ncbi:MucB/RseB C-terminal domain-containing protein [Halothiobacillus sp.]|uniref:MucB/RseB C-terminal domain-containing protein n=1 Tax=Halothiobacillus sp. TaxID=1891311 RepID=UPI002AD2B539|nr:MucB/RseB C-terminal domain-containing protein [Halothiobacillus sp.]